MESTNPCPHCLRLRRAWYAASAQLVPEGALPSPQQLNQIKRERLTPAYQTALLALIEHLESHKER